MDLPSASQPLSPEIEFLYGLHAGATRLGLDSTRKLLHALGSPEADLRILQVAGTNGKGTTTTLAASLLQAAGLRVGRFTSPHLLRVEERICVNTQPIEPQEFLQRVRDIRKQIESSGASFFEVITAIAALHFRDQKVDVAVFEVGLGGRLDSTTALPAAASIVTGVSWDHEAILGDSLPAILGEKLGIARPGVPLFTGLSAPELVAQARQHCAAVGAPLHVLPTAAAHVIGLDPYEGMQFRLAGVDVLLRCRFLGEHQARHGALAAAAVRHLLQEFPSVQPDRIWPGMSDAFLAGRFQVLPATTAVPETVIDVAHNQQSLHATLDLAQRFFAARKPSIVLGMLRDKRFDGVLERLRGWAGRLVLTAPAVARAWDLEAVRKQAEAVLGGAVPVEVVPQVASATARTQTSDDELVLVLGSHYLLAEALPTLASVRGVAPESLVRSPLRSSVGHS